MASNTHIAKLLKHWPAGLCWWSYAVNSIFKFQRLPCTSPQTGWLKTTEMYCLTVWQLEVQNQGVVDSGEESFLSLPSFRCLLAILGILWLVDTWLQSLPPSPRDVLPVCFSLGPNFPLLIGTPIILHLVPPPYPSPVWLNLIISAKTLFFNKVLSTGSRYMWIWGDTFKPIHNRTSDLFLACVADNFPSEGKGRNFFKLLFWIPVWPTRKNKESNVETRKPWEKVALIFHSSEKGNGQPFRKGALKKINKITLPKGIYLQEGCGL